MKEDFNQNENSQTIFRSRSNDYCTIISTPLHLSLLLHYHAICSPVDNEDAPAVKKYTKDLLDAGLIETSSRESKWETTEKGDVFVEKLCSTPLPTCQWV